MSWVGTVSRCPARSTGAPVRASRQVVAEVFRVEQGADALRQLRLVARLATGCRSARASGRPGGHRARPAPYTGSGVEKSRDGRKTQTRYAPPESPGRAKQRAFMVAATPHADDLEELRELLRTAGVATVGEVVQIRDKPHAEPVSRPGQGRRDQGAAEGRGRQPRRRRRRAHAAPAAQPRGRARPAGARPHRRDPRHLRRPRPLGRGQAPGRARPAGVQHGPHARPVDAPRASRRGSRRRRHRHPGPGRVPDRDRPPARARPHHRAAPPARPRALQPRGPARRARTRASAVGRSGRLHERRQVDAAERADRLRGRCPRPALPHARSRRPGRCACRAAPT